MNTNNEKIELLQNADALKMKKIVLYSLLFLILSLVLQAALITLGLTNIEYIISVESINYISIGHNLFMILGGITHLVGIFLFAKIVENKRLFIYLLIPIVLYILILFISYRIVSLGSQISPQDLIFIAMVFVSLIIMIVCVIKYFNLLARHTQNKAFTTSLICGIAGIVSMLVFAFSLGNTSFSIVSLLGMLTAGLSVGSVIYYTVGFLKIKYLYKN